MKQDKDLLINELLEKLTQAEKCIMRRLNSHRSFPPVSSARYMDMSSGIPFNDARDCDCDYCIEDRRWIVNYDNLYCRCIATTTVEHEDGSKFCVKCFRSVKQ